MNKMWFLRLLREAQKSRANGSAAIGFAIPEGQRNDTLTSLAGTMRRRGMGFDEIEAALLVTNNKRGEHIGSYLALLANAEPRPRSRKVNGRICNAIRHGPPPKSGRRTLETTIHRPFQEL